MQSEWSYENNYYKGYRAGGRYNETHPATTAKNAPPTAAKSGPAPPSHPPPANKKRKVAEQEETRRAQGPDRECAQSSGSSSQINASEGIVAQIDNARSALRSASRALTAAAEACKVASTLFEIEERTVSAALRALDDLDLQALGDRAQAPGERVRSTTAWE